jgi:hypothetical protein
MQPLTTSLLSRACRIFMDLAYPGGAATLPAKKRFYWEFADDTPITAYLPPAAEALGICQILRNKDEQPPGYEFRLGSSVFPHLKLRLQPVLKSGEYVWVCMVDTHDAFGRDARLPPPDHPDANQWLLLQETNQRLKERIETAFEQNGLATFNSILRDQLRS